ncbi:MAG: hypothetical protein ABSA17_04410 [Rhabdochlamydiaceae bacterium]
MSLLSLPNSLSAHVNTTMPIIRDTSLYANSGLSSIPKLTEERISLRTTAFIKSMSQTFFKQLDAPAVESLNELLLFISNNGVDSIPQDALVKNAGYFTRFFSSESWQDWCKDKTRLGEVVSLYCDCVTSTTGLKAFMDRIDKNLLQVSNKDAELLLKSLQAPKKSTDTQQEALSTTPSRSFWSSFLSLPVAEGHVFNAHNFNARTFPANFDVSTLNGANGFVLNGINTNDVSGWSVSGAGDVNGDGIADFVIGAPDASNTAGNAYVIFGSPAPWSSPISLSSLNGSNGFALIGVNAGDGSGSTVSGAGDINGDGIADLVVMASGAIHSGGNTCVIFGSTAPWNSSFSLSSLNGSNGFVLIGQNTNGGYSSVSGAGDINGDGIADLVVGIPETPNDSGNAYVVFGSTAPWNSSISLSSLNGSNGFVLTGVNAGDSSGWSVSGAGDINGDGIADFVVGAPGASSYTGNTYVVFGSNAPWNSSISLSSLNGTNGVVLNGENANDHCGWSVSGAGDINGDGIADLVVGAPWASAEWGKTYVIFGSTAPWSSPISLSSLNGTNGFVLNTQSTTEILIGWSVSGPGDVNGDGISDLIVSARYGDQGTEYGDGGAEAYVIYGRQGSWSSPLSLSTLNGVNGFNIINFESLVNSVSGAGDVNNDGIADIIIGTPSAGVSGSQTGQTVVIFGQQTGPTTPKKTTTTRPTTTTTTPTSTSTTTTSTTTTQTTTIPPTTTTTIPTTTTSTTTTQTTTSVTTGAPTTTLSTTAAPTSKAIQTTHPVTTGASTTTASSAAGGSAGLAAAVGILAVVAMLDD